VHALEMVREFGAELPLLHVVTTPDGNTETQSIPGTEEA